MSNSEKANKGGQGPHFGDVYRIVPGTLHVGDCRDPGGSSQPPDSIYDMSIIPTRCLQKNYVGRSHLKTGNKVRLDMLACGDEPGFKES